jgi:hypothetical protein
MCNPATGNSSGNSGRSGGRVGSADFDQYGFGRQQQMMAAVTALVAANLMAREVHPEDGREPVNSNTSLGRLVYFC